MWQHHAEGLESIVPMGEDLIHNVGHIQGDGLPTTDPTDEHPASSSQTVSQAPSSSRATPLSGTTMIPLARVQKLEGQISTLLHHLKPWMRKLIAEFVERAEKRMATMMDQKVQAVHAHLDAFEVKVLEMSAPTTYVTALRTDIASLRTDVDAIFTTLVVEPQAAPSALGDDTVLGALFSGDKVEEQPARARGKKHRFSRHPERTEAEKASRKQRKLDRAAIKASIVDEQLRERRVHEMMAGASSFMPVSEVLPTGASNLSTNDGAVRVTDSTTDGVVIGDAGTTEGDPSVDLAGSGKLDPLVC
uniref:Integrase core domain containing protein n=1 Tax=Solanum tuberosum TaxID=4113 RepID=M1DN02_SOLTU